MANEELIHFKKCIFSNIKEHVTDLQLILPDYYPDICRILSCRTNAYIENCKNEGDRVSADCIVICRLLYCTDDKSVHLYETEQRFNSVFEFSELKPDVIVDCRLKNINANFRAIGPRRVDVKSTDSIIVEIHDLTDIAANKSFDSCVECLEHDYELFDVHACYSGSFTIDEIFTVQDERIADSHLLFENNKINISEVKTVKDKILIKGIVRLNCTFLYSKENNLIKYSENVPFTQIIDIYGLSETDRCHIVTQPQRLFMSVKESGECNVQLQVRIKICAGAPVSAKVVTDLYAPGYEIEAEFCNEKMQNCVKNFSDTFQCNATVESKDSTDAKIVSIYALDVSHTEKFAQGEVKINGQITAGILLRANDELQFFTRNIPFDYSREIADSQDGHFVCAMYCNELAYNAGDTGLHLKAEMEIQGYYISEQAVAFVSSCNIGTCYNDDKEFEVISIYFADKGEKLWDIAKKNKIPLNTLKSTNELTCDTLEDDEILILIGAEV